MSWVNFLECREKSGKKVEKKSRAYLCVFFIFFFCLLLLRDTHLKLIFSNKLPSFTVYVNRIRYMLYAIRAKFVDGSNFPMQIVAVLTMCLQADPFSTLEYDDGNKLVKINISNCFAKIDEDSIQRRCTCIVFNE